MEKNEKDLAAGIVASEEASEVTMVMENDHGRRGEAEVAHEVKMMVTLSPPIFCLHCEC